MKLSIIAIVLLILYQIIKNIHYTHYLKKIPYRIHVNGSRGKSDVVRLIAAGLAQGGYQIWAKTTGTTPRLIMPDKELTIKRWSPVNISEQMKIVKKAAVAGVDVLILECMAIEPELQWISTNKLIKEQISVITNARPDHFDQMGKTVEEVAQNLALTISPGGKVFTADPIHAPIFAKQAAKVSAQIKLVDESNLIGVDLSQFPLTVFPENLALALAVCKSMGVEQAEAITGMKNYQPDPGAFKIYSFHLNQGQKSIYFANGFAANDPLSTEILFKKAIKAVEPEKLIGFYNHRLDRNFRFTIFTDFIQEAKFNQLVWLGRKIFFSKSLQGSADLYLKNLKAIRSYLMTLPDQTLIFGFGNIKGLAEELLEWLAEDGEVIC